MWGTPTEQPLKSLNAAYGVYVEFEKEAHIDTSGIEDRRGSQPAGSGLPTPSGGGGMGGGAVGGIVGALLVLVLGALGVSGNIPGLQATDNSSDNRALQEKCDATNPNRFAEADCRQAATFVDLRDYWRDAVPQQLGVAYSDPKFVLFSEAVNTGCGFATSQVGPFYCPADQKIYIDLGFYQDLTSQYGASGQFAQAYVLAHEFGHHIQYLTGVEKKVRQAQQRDRGNANAYSIALELQADCYAGVWTKNAAAPDGLITGVSEADLRSALSAAEAVGDDRIQEKTQGQVNPETWTHGSAQQRQDWFFRGYQTGDPRQCDTFATR